MKLNWAESGNANGELIIFIHGFMGDSSDWNIVKKSFEKNYHILAVDLPGHGKSDLPSTPYTFTSIAENIRQKIKKYKKSSYISGYSLGGRVALYCLDLFPELIRGIILESSHPGITSKKEKKERYGQDIKMLQQVKSNEELKLFLCQWYSSSIFKNINKHKNYFSMINKKTNNNITNLKKSLKYLSLGIQRDFWPLLKRTNIPILFLSGELDLKYSEIGKNLSNINHKIIELNIKNASHNIHFTHSEKYISEIEYFLEGI